MSPRSTLVPVLVLVLGACLPADPPGRVLFVGVDGMSPEMVAEMTEAGELTHLRAMAEQGASGTLAPSLPLLSPRIWTTIATGKPASEHGILHFVRTDDSGRRRLYAGDDRRVPALWNILGERDLTVAIVNWLLTHPPERVNGVMITDHALPGVLERRQRFFDPVGGAHRATGLGISYAYPESWQARVSENLSANTPLTSIASPFEENGRAPTTTPAADFQRFWSNDEVVVRTALQVLDEVEPDLLLVYLPGLDRISHFFWPAVVPPESLPPSRRLSPYKAALDAKTLRTYYRYVDALLGRLSESYGPDDLVLVVSDHGFEAGTEPNDMPGVHRSETAAAGIFYLRGRGVPAGRIESIEPVDIAPLILAWLGLPAANDMTGEVPAGLELGEHGRVATYDTIKVERLAGPGSEVEEEILDELRSLDYIE